MLAVTGNGVVYSFGSGSNFCLGHGEQHDELQPRAIQTFRRKGIHVVRVSAGDEHVVALDSSGYVSLSAPRRFIFCIFCLLISFECLLLAILL